MYMCNIGYEIIQSIRRLARLSDSMVNGHLYYHTYSSFSHWHRFQNIIAGHPIPIETFHYFVALGIISETYSHFFGTDRSAVIYKIIKDEVANIALLLY